MKTLVIATLLLFSNLAMAADLTEPQVAACVRMHDAADAVVTAKGNNVSKSQIYSIIAENSTDDAAAKKLFYAVTDMVFKGATPEVIFDACIEYSKEKSSQDSRTKTKSAPKAGYIAL